MTEKCRERGLRTILEICFVASFVARKADDMLNLALADDSRNG